MRLRCGVSVTSLEGVIQMGSGPARANRMRSSCVASRYRIREPDEYPASILIIWPQAPSVIDPRRFGATANGG